MAYDKRIKNLTALVIILSIVVLAAGVYILYTNKTSEENIIYQDENITKEANQIFNKIADSYYYLTEDVNINDLPNEQKLNFMALYYSYDITEYTSDEIYEELKKLFGKNFTIEFKDIKLEPFSDNSEPDYIYDEVTKKYIDNGNGHGLEGTNYLIKSLLVDYKKNDDEYILSYKQLFYIYDYDEVLFTDITGKNILFKKGISDEEENSVSVKVSDGEFNRYMDKLPIVEYTFKLEDGKLILIKYSIK